MDLEEFVVLLWIHRSIVKLHSILAQTAHKVVNRGRGSFVADMSCWKISLDELYISMIIWRFPKMGGIPKAALAIGQWGFSMTFLPSHARVARYPHDEQGPMESRGEFPVAKFGEREGHCTCHDQFTAVGFSVFLFSQARYHVQKVQRGHGSRVKPSSRGFSHGNIDWNQPNVRMS